MGKPSKSRSELGSEEGATVPDHYGQIQPNKPLEKALALLVSWKLHQLCDVFREQEVCIRAFKLLTEADIAELIPKIGPRVIFRTYLRKWLQSNDPKEDFEKQEEENNLEVCSESISADQLLIKLERVDEDEEWVEAPQEMEDTNYLDSEMDMDTTEQSCKPSLNHTDILAQGTPSKKHGKTKDDLVVVKGDGKQLIKNFTQGLSIRDILRADPCGRRAIYSYEETGELSSQNRKYVVKLIISEFLRRDVKMCPEIYTALAHQVVEVFPSEKIETYYVPRIGVTCPKGTLYNKYVNMTRRSRGSGAFNRTAP